MPSSPAPRQATSTPSGSPRAKLELHQLVPSSAALLCLPGSGFRPRPQHDDSDAERKAFGQPTLASLACRSHISGPFTAAVQRPRPARDQYQRHPEHARRALSSLWRLLIGSDWQRLEPRMDPGLRHGHWRPGTRALNRESEARRPCAGAARRSPRTGARPMPGDEFGVRGPHRTGREPRRSVSRPSAPCAVRTLAEAGRTFLARGRALGSAMMGRVTELPTVHCAPHKPEVPVPPSRRPGSLRPRHAEASAGGMPPGAPVRFLVSPSS